MYLIHGILPIRVTYPIHTHNNVRWIIYIKNCFVLRSVLTPKIDTCYTKYGSALLLLNLLNWIYKKRHSEAKRNGETPTRNENKNTSIIRAGWFDWRFSYSICHIHIQSRKQSFNMPHTIVPNHFWSGTIQLHFMLTYENWLLFFTHLTRQF